MDKFICNQRLPNESFKAYKARRCAAKLYIKDDIYKIDENVFNPFTKKEIPFIKEKK